MRAYLPRVADRELERRLRTNGAVVIEGPRASGKTATALQVANTVHRLDDPASRALVTLDPPGLFSGATPILFDEWQQEPDIWNLVRHEIDARRAKGSFILTGSARPRDDANRHSGAGRFGVLPMRPMSLFESGQSTGEISLEALLAGERQSGQGSHLSFDEILHRIVIGGWPELIDKEEDYARTWLEDYLTQISEVDIPMLSGRARNPRNLSRLLESLARSVGQPTKISQLAKDVGGENPIARETLTNYLDAFDRLRLTDNSAAWQPHMRSRTRLRATPVRYFVDPSIGPAALRIGTAELRSDPLALGFHFEALAIRDLRIYSQLHWGRVDSWRDANGNKVDAIITARDNKWGAIEIKLNPRDIDDAAAALLRFAANVDTSRHKEPAFLGVITSTGAGGLRPDGVHVIPIGAFGP